MSKRSQHPIFLYFLALTFILSPSTVFAVGSGGFENAAFSAMSLAQGNAVTAQGEEPAAISYNPAAITELPGVQVQYNSAFISLFTWYDNSPTGQPDTRSSGTISHIPTAYLTVNPGKFLNDRLTLGIGTDSPFGLANKYDSRHPAMRYSVGHVNWLKMFSVKPVVAIKVNEKISIAAGPVWYRIFSTGSISQYPNFFLAGAGAIDGQYRTDLAGNSWGWQMGIKVKPTKKHHFGFYFRSPVHINLKGQADVENSSFSPNFVTSARTKINLPLNVTLGYAFRPNEKAVIEFDAGWTKWSQFKRAIVDHDSVTAADNALMASLGAGHADYSDVFSLHLGGNYQVNEKLNVQAGTHFYWTPLPKGHFRPNVPDSNSLGVAVGGSYKVTPNLTADLTYYNRFWFKRSVDNDLVDFLGVQVDGDWRSWAQAFMVGVRYKWDLFDAEQRSQAMKGTIQMAGAPA